MTQLQLGLERQREGLSRVSAHNAYFLERMRAEARRIAVSEGSVSSDRMRTFAKEKGLYPESAQTWGAIFKGRGWKVISRRPSEYESNHGRYINVFAWLG